MAALSVAVVGVGHLGKEHARVYAGCPEVELVGVVDPDHSRGVAIARKYGTRYLADYKDLPDSVEALSIAAPTRHHFEIASYFLERGASVLLEKPMTANLREALALVQTSRGSAGILQVGHIERFNPAFRAIEPFVCRPCYLESVRVSPYPWRSSDIGAVLDLMIHDIDIVLHLARSDVQGVDALGVSVLSDSEDMATARIEFRSGAVANLTASRVSGKRVRQMRVFQSNCYISVDYDKRQASICRRPQKPPREVMEGGHPDPARQAERESLLRNLLCVEPLAVEDCEPLQLEIQSFIRCVRAGEAPVVGGQEGLKAMQTAHAILEKIRLNAWNRAE